MTCIFLLSSAVRVLDSQAYRKMDVTRERISCQMEQTRLAEEGRRQHVPILSYREMTTLIKSRWCQTLERKMATASPPRILFAGLAMQSRQPTFTCELDTVV